jgi:ATP-dependent RNA helicase SUPV3L1/SUV3
VTLHLHALVKKMQTRGKITAVLGPTNTGKTHLAIERMLGHRTGIIGCPLRLLAREIYDKVVLAKGSSVVALVTGEEKIIPRHPKFYICTTESMPIDRFAEFLAVDEIQLAADPERGHVFTDRILHARGLVETMFLGSLTIRPLIKALIPEAEIISRPRFSKLTYSGEKKITRLPARSIIVAFSTSEVYLLAESIRRIRGGSAVVLGALSPRTRNAQVAMFEEGEVDYLVATDAIGMGLNLNVHHVAFAQLKKFDGQRRRSLTAPEIAQVAGRAGRHMRDGSFGSTAGAGPIAAEIVSAVEEHAFPALARIYWRNTELSFASVEQLLESLEQNPTSPRLLKPRNVGDVRALRALASDPTIKARAYNLASVSLLWEICRIPDFQKILSDAHFHLLKEIFIHLSGPKARLPDAWVQKMSRRLDQTAGDIETLAGRIAHIRTWNYIAHRPDWVRDPEALQRITRQIEDRLSDALHDRLTQRFVDRKMRAIVRGYGTSGQDSVQIQPEGSIIVANETVGRLEGINFIPSAQELPMRPGILQNTIRGAVASQLQKQVDLLCRSTNEKFTLLADYTIIWNGGTAGRLHAGPDILKPKVTSIHNEMLDGPMRIRIQQRLQRWLDQHISSFCNPMFNVMNAVSLGHSKAIAFRLLEGMGNTSREGCESLVRALSPEERKLFAKLNVRLGHLNLFIPAMLKAETISLRDRLWQLHAGTKNNPPPPGRVAVDIVHGLDPAYYHSVGYQPLGSLALRIDMLERFGAVVRKKARSGAFEVNQALVSLIGLRKEQVDGVLNDLGYRRFYDKKNQKDFGQLNLILIKPNIPMYKRKSAGNIILTKKRKTEKNEHGQERIILHGTSPFAVLRNIKFSTK